MQYATAVWHEGSDGSQHDPADWPNTPETPMTEKRSIIRIANIFILPSVIKSVEYVLCNYKYR